MTYIYDVLLNFTEEEYKQAIKKGLKDATIVLTSR